MNVVVALVIVAGLAAVAARFLLRSGPGGDIVLPRMVDDSIGMYVLRRVTGRRLGDRRLADVEARTPRVAPRLFDGEMARRLGIRAAGEVRPRPRPSAGAWRQPSSAEVHTRRGLHPVAIGMLTVVTIVIGLAVGAGLGLIVPQS